MNTRQKLTTLLLMSSAIVGAASSVQAQTASTDTARRDEIIVTATKRATTIRDVPYNISAVSGDDLEKLGISDIGGLANLVPGFNYIDLGARGSLVNSSVNIRGVNAEATDNASVPLASVAPVSTYLDETPIFANLRLVDIERVEILRGPQGTLYGSGSLGGTVRFIQNKPSLDVFEATAIASAGITDGAGDVNHSFDGIVNIPVSETFAIRASAGIEKDAGYIDYNNLYALDASGAPTLATPGDTVNSASTFTSLEDANEDKSWSARVAGYWEPTDRFNALLAFHHQNDKSGALSAITPTAFGGDDRLENNAFAVSPFESDVDLLSLDMEVDLGFASLTSSTSKSKVNASGSYDSTAVYLDFGFYEGTYGANPRDYIRTDSGVTDKSFVQEFRLISQHDGPIDWVLGAYYRKQDFDGQTEDNAAGAHDYFTACATGLGFDPLDPFYDPFVFPSAEPCGTGSPFGVPGLETVAGFPVTKDLTYINNFQQEFKDTAIFGELTYNISDRWQVTGGFRAFWQDFENAQQNGAFYTARSLLANGFDPSLAVRDVTSSTSVNDVIFKANTSFDIADDHKFYATVSEGFRRGGVNGLPTLIFDFDIFDAIPVNTALFQYTPDKVTNYEIGLKGRLGEMNYNAAFFRLDWDDVQINELVTSNALSAVINGGTAKSQGIELELNGNVTENLHLATSYTYNRAFITEYSPLLVAEVLFGVDPGSPEIQLPGTPKHSISASAIYTQPLANDSELSFDLSGNYTGSVTTSVFPGRSRDIGGHTLIDAGLTYGKDAWDVRLSVNNVFNNRAVLVSEGVRLNNAVANGQSHFFIAKPRTIALTGTYHFD